MTTEYMKIYKEALAAADAGDTRAVDQLRDRLVPSDRRIIERHEAAAKQAAAAAATRSDTPSEQPMHSDRDPVRWAKEFNAVLERRGKEPLDEGWLLGWFAAAFMCGEDTYRWRKEESARSEIAPISDEFLTSMAWEMCIPLEGLAFNRTEDGSPDLKGPVRLSLDEARLLLKRALAKAPNQTRSATLQMPDDVKLVTTVFDCFRSDQTRRALLRTVWKDSIDIEEPTYELREFVRHLLSR